MPIQLIEAVGFGAGCKLLQHSQGAVGLAPHQAVDGGQLGQRGMGQRRAMARRYRPITRVVTSDHHRQPKHESYEEIPFHCRKNNEKKTLDSKDLLLLPQIKT